MAAEPDPEIGIANNSGTTETNGINKIDEAAWGPDHACFPHLNPHVPITSPLYSTTRIIRVKRDWSTCGDLAPQYANVYPELLDGYLSEAQFRDIVTSINMMLIRAFSPFSWRAFFDATMGFITGWIWEDIGATNVKRDLRSLENWLEDWNQKVLEPRGCRIIPLRRTGYLTIDFQIPDPKITPELPDPVEYAHSEADRRSIKSYQRSISGRYSIGRRGSTRARSEYSVRTVSKRSTKDDETEARAPVPPIPKKYLEERANAMQAEAGAKEYSDADAA